jgi:hypothetical protein
MTSVSHVAKSRMQVAHTTHAFERFRAAFALAVIEPAKVRALISRC